MAPSLCVCTGLLAEKCIRVIYWEVLDTGFIPRVIWVISRGTVGTEGDNPYHPRDKPCIQNLPVNDSFISYLPRFISEHNLNQGFE